MTDIATVVAALRQEAQATDRRRLLVVTGADGHETCRAVADTAATLAVVSGDDSFDALTESVETYERQPATHAGRLMGTTYEAVVYDGTDEFSPNALGRTVGAVGGGGVYVLLLPTDWTDRVDDFRASLAVAPFEPSDPTSAFRERLLATFDHPGVAVYDADADRLRRNGLTGRERPPPRSTGTLPTDPGFPPAAYEACHTADQGRSLRALERLREAETAVVVEADRGRGKSAVAGLAAGALAAAGHEVAVTAPARSNAGTLLEHAAELTETLGVCESTAPLVTAAGGRVEYVSPTELDDHAETADAVFVDEAAGLPVARLSAALAADRVAFVTTVHGYEGAGRGFSVRFRDRLADARHAVTETRPREPIRHAPGDPLESWSFRALALDARPAVDPLVADASLADATYERLSTDRLRGDDHRLREAFGLLVVAHYRTEPTDLARLLDAPNLSVHALLVDGHVAAVALVAREGGLSQDRRRSLFDGDRIHGNMVPDLLGGQLRDPEAARPVGYRVVRIATHGALRRSGFGSRLLSAVETDLAGADRPESPPADYLASGFGASPGVVDFWRQNGYRSVHLSTTRNDTSGEHSTVVVRPVTDAGRALVARHETGFRDRIADALSDGLRSLDADVVRATLRACAADPGPTLDLTDYEWRIVVGAGTGPTGYGVAPGPFRRLAVAWFLDTDAPEEALDARQERLLVRKVLQGHPWDAVTAELGFVSTGECMRTLGATVRALVDRFGGEPAARERARYD